MAITCAPPPAGWERCALCGRGRPAAELRTLAGVRVCARCVPVRRGQESLYARSPRDLDWLDDLHRKEGANS